MTFLEAINAVLRRLREDTVTSSNSTDYSKLIGDFVNQAQNECEHAWNWNTLTKENVLLTSSGTAQYNVFNYPADVENIKEFIILQMINETKQTYLRAVTKRHQQTLDYLVTLSGSPYYYSVRDESSGVPQITLTPTPTATETIRVLFIEYTQDRAIDGTDDSDVFKIPALPIVLNAYARAVSERGEDGGIGINEADQAARSALADAISIDATSNHFQDLSWHEI